jgi:hypothetical protein
MKTLDAERSNILAYFFENPTDYAPVKAQRLEELNQEMESLEAKWLEDEEMISSLRDEIEKTRG